MTVTISDIKRAILDGGDVAAFIPAWQKALRNPPVLVTNSLETPVSLPSPEVLLKSADERLAEVVVAWAEGKTTALTDGAPVELTAIGFAPYGHHTGAYLEHVIDELRPDVIALEVPPLELSAAMVYAFGIPGAISLPLYGEIMSQDLGQFYAQETFYPGNTNQIAVVKSWLNEIPLVPVGMPRRQPKYVEADYMMAYLDDSAAMREMSKVAVHRAYGALDEAIKAGMEIVQGEEVSREVSLGLMRAIDGSLRETLVEEACYIASRIMEAAAGVSSRRQKVRVLALVDITHYTDVQESVRLLKRGIREEIYIPPVRYATARGMAMSSRYSEELNEESEQYAPKVNSIQNLFESALEKLMGEENGALLTESDIDRLIPEIVNRTRFHPAIARGASVRGTIACKEVLAGLAAIMGGLKREALARAAMIVLPPRITAKPGNNETDIVRDIVKETLYGIHFSNAGKEIVPLKAVDWASPEDIMKNLKDLQPLSESANVPSAHNKLPAVMAERGRNEEILKLMEAKNLIRRGKSNQFSFTQKAMEYLMKELEEKLKSGEISPMEYNQEKSRLQAMLKNISPQFKMSSKDMANTIMELMDSQDKQWNSQVSFERMHIYYHIKANSMHSDLSPEKRDYYGLKMLIEDLEKQGILSAAENAGDLTLTGQALNILLDYLITKDPRGKGIQGTIDFGKTLVNERRYEIRKYTSGDVFRDISVRHTLKEIARQKKDLQQVRRSDFRVFLKQRRKLQSDIVLCMDVSGSMGFQHKLMYARLAAVGLVKAAIENGDRVGVVAFNNYGQTTTPLTDKDEDSVISYIVKLSARGNTNIGDGVRCASDLLSQDHSHNQKYIILITDGQPTAISEGIYDRLKEFKEKDLTEESSLLETRRASAKGVKVSVIHIATKNEGSDEFIRNIARTGKGKVRRLSSSGDLQAISHR